MNTKCKKFCTTNGQKATITIEVFHMNYAVPPGCHKASNNQQHIRCLRKHCVECHGGRVDESVNFHLSQSCEHDRPTARVQPQRGVGG